MHYRKKFEEEAAKRLKPGNDLPVLTSEDTASLPEPVRKYLIYTGAVGKPRIQNFRLLFRGQMKLKRRGEWVKVSSRQYNFFDKPARFFYIRAAMAGIPFVGLHEYADANATMKIKVASLFRVVDAQGEMMSRGETVTIFNDMCFMAPATLVSRDIQWETIDQLNVRAVFTNGNITVSAVLSFNEKGELINFISHDRYLCEDGKTYLNYPWSTPISNYIPMEGRMVPTYGEAIWHMPEGEFCYAKLTLEDLKYNCTALD